MSDVVEGATGSPWVLLRTGCERAAIALGDLVSPPRCVACDVLLERRAVFCRTCAASVVVRPTLRDGTWAWVEWGGPIKEAIVRMKYGRREDVGRALATILATTPLPERPRLDVLAPVPLHPKRLAARGFNQATLLARALGRAFDARLVTRRLVRTLDTSPQAQKSASERRAAVGEAFSARGVAGLRVGVVDDVVTTGSTLAACSEALLAAGAVAVERFALARAD